MFMPKKEEDLLKQIQVVNDEGLIIIVSLIVQEGLKIFRRD